MERNCEHCGRAYIAKSVRAKFCKEAECIRSRDAARKRRGPGGDVAPVVLLPTAADGECGPLERAARDELLACDRADTFAGRLALGLARRMDAGSRDTGSGVSSLSKELRAAMADATKDAPRAADAIDELKARRLRHA